VNRAEQIQLAAADPRRDAVMEEIR